MFCTSSSKGKQGQVIGYCFLAMANVLNLRLEPFAKQANAGVGPNIDGVLEGSFVVFNKTEHVTILRQHISMAGHRGTITPQFRPCQFLYNLFVCK